MAKFSERLQKLLARANAEQPRKRPGDEEHRTQCSCVRWFRYQYPQFRHNLFAVPNGGRRDLVTGAKMKAEGVLAGVTDFIFLKRNKCYGALLIEMKTRNGRLSESQREWKRLIERDGYKYVVCRSLDDFIREITSYLDESN